MIVGASFAWFVASTGSNAGSVNTSSSGAKMDFISYTSAWMSGNLIPATTEIVEYSVERRPDSSGNKICTDDGQNGDGQRARSICSLYVFQILNKSQEDQDLSIKLVSESNGFQNLKAMIYEISEEGGDATGNVYDRAAISVDDPKFATADTQDDNAEYVEVQDSAGDKIVDFSPIYVNRLGVHKKLLSVGDVKSVAVDVGATGETAELANGIQIPKMPSDDDGTIDNKKSYLKTFMIVLYINESGDNQTTNDGSKGFSGTVQVDGADGATRITGRIDNIDSSTLQGNG